MGLVVDLLADAAPSLLATLGAVLALPFWLMMKNAIPTTAKAATTAVIFLEAALAMVFLP